MQISVKLDRSKLDRKKPGPVHLMVSLIAPEVAEEERKPIDVVLVLDTSPSMTDPATKDLHGPTKFLLAKTAIRRFIEQLRPTDRFGLVTFSSGASVLVPLEAATKEHCALAFERLVKLQTVSGTNLVAGAKCGLDVLKKEAIDAAVRVRRVVLFTDGLPTVGPTAHSEVVSQILSQVNNLTPITAVGFGAAIVANGQGDGGYDPELLTSIARNSGGNFYHAEGEDGILKAFANELGALRSVAATHVNVEIKPDEEVGLAEILNDYPINMVDNTTSIKVGSLYGGERQHLVARLFMPLEGVTSPNEMYRVAVKVTGLEVVIGETFTAEQAAILRYVGSEEADSKPDPEVETERLRLAAAKMLEGALAQAVAGHHAVAVNMVEEMAADLAALGTPDASALAGSLGLMADDLSDANRLAAQAGEIRSTTRALHTRRAAGSSYVDDHYTTAAQSKTLIGMSKPPKTKKDDE